MIEMQSSVEAERSVDSVASLSGSPGNHYVSRSVVWSARRHWECFLQSSRFSVPLFLADVALATLILFLAALIWTALGATLTSTEILTIALSQTLALTVCFAAVGLYRNVGMHPVEELERVVTAVAMTGLVTILVLLMHTGGQDLGKLSLVGMATVVSCLVLPSARHLLRCFLGRTNWWRRPVVIVSHSLRAEQFVVDLERERHLGWRPIGFVQDFRVHWKRENTSSLCLGDEEDLPEIVQKYHVFWGLLDVKSLSLYEAQSFIDRHHHSLPHVVTVLGNSGDSALFARGISCGSTPGVHYQSMHALIVPRLLKRAIDVLVSGIALLVFSPLIAVIALAVRLSSPGPIFYSQERLGLKGKTFRIWKFRSMVQNAERVLQDCLKNDPAMQEEWRRTQKLTSDPRITAVGKLLRKTSLDEIPQLWNVFNGTMSLVGPRPIVHSEIEKYGDVYWLYAKTKPGITGLWQVSGRNHTTYSERLEYDSFYVRNWSIWLDWYLLLKTFRVVVLCEGAY